MAAVLSRKAAILLLIVASLGYLVDMFDFFLYNMVRAPSLADLGLSGDALTTAGLTISNFQMAGVLAGSFAWGFIGDRFGRKRSLFASILIYSLASLACGYVASVDAYTLWRFVAGFGIAGELGAGVTLIAEQLPPRRRGLGIILFITAGFAGVLLSMGLVALLPWRSVYLCGGVGGLLLLLVRALVSESGLFVATRNSAVRRGDLRLLLGDRRRLVKFVAGFCTIAPATFVPQIIWTLSPELAAAYGVTEPVRANIVLGAGFGCAFIGDFTVLWLSEKLRSRKRALRIMQGAALAVFAAYLAWPLLLPVSYASFLCLSMLMGLTQGVWAMGITASAEQFGTNIRATVATIVPSLARSLTIPMNLTYKALRPYGALPAVAIIGLVIFALSFWGRRRLEETYGRELDYVET